MEELENALTGAQQEDGTEFGFDFAGALTGAEAEEAGDGSGQDAGAQPEGAQPEDAEPDTGAAEDAGEEPEGGTEAEAGPKAAEELLTLKYYGQEVQLPRDQVVALAQRGMDYDKVRAERDALRNDKGRRLLERYAEASGMPVEEYLGYLERELEQASIKRETDAGMSDAQARELLQLRRNEAARREEDRAREARQRQNELYMELLREYPEIRQLPPEVVQRIAKGETPLAAYRAYDLARTKEQLARQQAAAKAAAAAERNARTAAGSAAGLGAGQEDGFLSGFLSGFER